MARRIERSHLSRRTLRSPRGSGHEIAVRRGDRRACDWRRRRGCVRGGLGRCVPPLRLGGTRNDSSEPVLRRMGRSGRRSRDSASSLLAADDARMGATLYELAPDAPEMRMHMHFGAEEMFFVLSGRPVFRNQHGEEEMAPGDFVFCPEDVPDCTRSATPPKNPLRSSRSVPGASRTSSPTPNTDMHGWRLAIPIPSYSREAATPASSLASRSRSSRSFGRLSAVARDDEEAAGGLFAS